MDKYVLHSSFNVIVIDLNAMDIILKHNWMEPIGATNINVQNKSMNIW